jgi:DNA-binding response OmpR family regulator
MIATPPPPLPDDRDNLQPEDKKLLIIDDDHNFLRIMQDLAHEHDFKCLVAEDGMAGLLLAEEYRPTAIILDVGLPKVNGWSVMESLKDSPNTRHIPVHFISAHDDSAAALRMGAIGYSVSHPYR